MMYSIHSAGGAVDSDWFTTSATKEAQFWDSLSGKLANILAYQAKHCNINALWADHFRIYELFCSKYKYTRSNK